MLKPQHIASQIRSQIVRGQLKAGEHLPTYPRLQKRFRAAKATIHSAIQMLKQQGFVTTAGRNGMIVSRDLPHVHRFAVVLPPCEYPNFFFASIIQALPVIMRETRIQFDLFENVDETFSSPARERLEQAVEEHRYGALLTVHGGKHMLSLCRRQIDEGLPVILIGSCQDSALPFAAHCVNIDQDSFFRYACAAFRRHGCHRIATIGFRNDSLPAHLEDLFNEYELEFPEVWQIAVDVKTPRSTERVVRLLMQSPAERPDGLLIMDDHHLVPAGRALMNCPNLEIGHDIAVVAHANWPRIPDVPFPVDLVGIDMFQLLRMATELAVGALHRKPVQTVSIAHQPLLPERMDRNFVQP